MSKNEDKVGGNFYAYRESGWGAVTPEINNFSLEGRRYLKDKQKPTRTEKLKLRLAMQEFKHLMGLKDWSEAGTLLSKTSTHKEKSDKAIALYGRMFGLEGSPEMLERQIETYGEMANDVIKVIKKNLTTRFVDLSQSEEVEQENNPFRLGLMLLDKNLNPQRRFEAKRKLLLMRLAGTIDSRRREVDTEKQYSTFKDFLSNNVWAMSGDQPTTEDSILSTHNLSDMSCIDARILSKNDADNYSPKPDQRIETVERRRIVVDGKSIPVLQDTREKSMTSKIIKLLRKGKDNPASAVEDELGLMAVLENKADINRFIRHLHDKAIETGSAVTFEDPEDTYGEGGRENHSIGGSSDIRMVKFHARAHGARPEILLLTTEEYLNYKLKDGVAHDEYEIERIFKSGVMDFLFPEDFYKFDRERMKNVSIELVRRKHRTVLGV